jgi:TatA/E family protein of Tat protein translocase
VLDLSPTKLIIIFVVVVVLLGPKRLPEVARQLGAGWRKLRDVSARIDRELRQTVPDLPSSQDIVRFARSPITLLNQLADRTDEGVAAGGGDGAPGPVGAVDGGGVADALDGVRGADDASAAGVVPDAAHVRRDGVRGRGLSPVPAPSFAALDADDPNLN